MAGATAIALSGGIDSLVAASLLKEQGQKVIALHFLTGLETESAAGGPIPDQAFALLEKQTYKRLAPLAANLGIPLHIIDLRDQFKREVVDYFIRTYQAGRTPNPCLVCNHLIKFEILFNKALQLGAGRIATGHYARTRCGNDGRMHLACGRDPFKDQSYFLSRLTQVQLTRAVFPLGEMTKDQTRAIAAQKGLVPVTTSESQDVCFIRDGNYGDFLTNQPAFHSHPGPIEDVQGRVLGRHGGLHRYTIGQRRGIDCPAAQPYYVVRIEPQRNCLVVGGKADLLASSCRVEGINWIIPPSGDSMRTRVRIRYRHVAVPATVTRMENAAAEVVFDRPEAAVTPGQGAVFYSADEVLGAGWIRR
jgi:tRNA-uridine 2-sulfurtransferase